MKIIIKRLQKTIGKLLYYARAIDPTMLMTLNSLAVVQTNPKIKTAKQVTRFFNYSATYPYAVTEYRRSVMILHIYLDASYISKPEALSRAGGYYLLGQKSNTPIQTMPLENVPIHLE